MNLIGSLGDVNFVVDTTNKIRTFMDFNRTSSSRWASNEIVLQKPKSQFLGPGLDTITFKIQLNVRYGVNPRAEMEKLLAYERDGKVLLFIVGGKKLGVNKWRISGLTQDWKTIDNRGNLLISELSVSLEEYA